MTREVDSKLRTLFDRLPGLWGCKDEHSTFMYANESYGRVIGVDHHLEVIGRTDFDMPCGTVACAGLFQAQDAEVMASGQSLRILDVHPFADGEWRAYLFEKTPLVTEDDRVIGTIFHGSDITSTSTIELGSLLGRVNAGFSQGALSGQDSYIINVDRGPVRLTPRQAEILFFLIRGKSNRSVAEILNMSRRTVEYHIEQLKVRFAVYSKAELIDEAIGKGYLHYIPETLFKQQLSITLR